MVSAGRLVSTRPLTACASHPQQKMGMVAPSVPSPDVRLLPISLLLSTGSSLPPAFDGPPAPEKHALSSGPEPDRRVFALDGHCLQASRTSARARGRCIRHRPCVHHRHLLPAHNLVGWIATLRQVNPRDIVTGAVVVLLGQPDSALC